MPSKVWDEITNPFLNFNGATVEVKEWISKFIVHFIIDVISYPCLDQSSIMLETGAICAIILCRVFLCYDEILYMKYNINIYRFS